MHSGRTIWRWLLWSVSGSYPKLSTSMRWISNTELSSNRNWCTCGYVCGVGLCNQIHARTRSKFSILTIDFHWCFIIFIHYNDVIMSAMTSQITGVSIVCSTLGSNTDQRKHLSSASLAFVRGIHRWPVNSLHKWPVTRRRFPLDDVIMVNSRQAVISTNADPIHWHKCTALGGDKFIVCDSPPISTVLAQMLHACNPGNSIHVQIDVMISTWW